MISRQGQRTHPHSRSFSSKKRTQHQLANGVRLKNMYHKKLLTKIKKIELISLAEGQLIIKYHDRY